MIEKVFLRSIGGYYKNFHESYKHHRYDLRTDALKIRFTLDSKRAPFFNPITRGIIRVKTKGLLSPIYLVRSSNGRNLEARARIMAKGAALTRLETAQSRLVREKLQLFLYPFLSLSLS